MTPWPAVFNGIGALTVDASAFDPDGLADRIHGLSWIAQKVGGADTGDDLSRQHNTVRWRFRGLTVGQWVYCTNPAVDARTANAGSPQLVVYDVEEPYKTDAGAPADWPAKLVAAHKSYGSVPAAVTSYGAIPGYGNQPSSIDFGPFVEARWPIMAQGYDSFTCADRVTYLSVYPPEGIHCLTRTLQLDPGESVYRPESIDA